MKKAQSPYSVNTMAVLAARAAIRDRAYVESYVDEVLAARALAYEGLHELGIKTFPERGEFYFVPVG